MKVRVFRAKWALLEGEPNQENKNDSLAEARYSVFLYSAHGQFGSLMLALRGDMRHGGRSGAKP
jgi:hypothetical protein